MSRRRARSSSAATCSMARWLSAQNRWCVVHSPCTRACRMNSSRETTGSIEPYCTRRPTTSGMPYSVTRSVATTEPRLASQRGSLYCRLTRWSASRSTTSGSIRATVRANSRLVSTSSAAATQRGGFFASGVPGASTKRVFRVPTYSRDGRLSPLACSAWVPIWDSSPASRDAVTPFSSGSVASAPVVMPSRLAVPVLPLADAQVVQELALHGAPELVAAERVLLLGQVPPEVEQAQEVGVLVGEPAVQLVGGLLVLGRPLTHVLHGEPGGDDQHLLQHTAPVGLDDHPGDPRVQRQRGERPAGLGELPVGVECAQL